jgi:hypothetical protein
MINRSRPGKRLSYALPLKENKVRAKYGGGGQNKREKKLGTEMRTGEEIKLKKKRWGSGGGGRREKGTDEDKKKWKD